MGIEFVRTLRDAGFKALSIIVSYKVWILATATWLVAGDRLSELYWFLLAVLVISTRAFEKIAGIPFTGRTAVGHSRPATTGTDQGAGEET
jgi:hypothetical protein